VGSVADTVRAAHEGPNTTGEEGSSSARRRAPDSRGRRRLPRGQLALVLTQGLLVAVNLAGIPYYVLPMAERVRSPLHPWLKPSGYIGQSAGVLALALLLFLWLYPVRKKLSHVSWLGPVASWLDAHIVAGCALPLLVAIHASWRFEGLIGLGYLALLVVCASGLVGRYLYVRIPRSKSGLELSVEEAVAQRKLLVYRIAAATRLQVELVEAVLAPPRARPRRKIGLGGAIVQMIRDDGARRRAVRALGRWWEESAPTRAPVDRAALAEVLRLARREMALAQQLRMLDETHRLFRYWHAAHRPVALTALLAVVLHVAVVVAVGATWFL